MCLEHRVTRAEREADRNKGGKSEGGRERQRVLPPLFPSLSLPLSRLHGQTGRLAADAPAGNQLRQQLSSPADAHLLAIHRRLSLSSDRQPFSRHLPASLALPALCLSLLRLMPLSACLAGGVSRAVLSLSFSLDDADSLSLEAVIDSDFLSLLSPLLSLSLSHYWVSETCDLIPDTTSSSPSAFAQGARVMRPIEEHRRRRRERTSAGERQ